MLEHIELGGGSSPEYQPNFDIMEHPSVTKKCDLTKGIPLGDNEVKHIYSRDFVEHLTFSDFIRLLKECRRVLIDEGQIEFITPNVYKCLYTHNEWNEHTHNLVIGNYLVAKDGWDKSELPMRHKAWYTPELMQYILEHEGWHDIQITEYKKDTDHWKEPKMKVIAKK